MAEAAASRYAYVAAGGVPLSGERLDGIVRDKSVRLAESALRADGSVLTADELTLRSLAALTSAELVGRDEALASFAQVDGRPFE